MNQKRYAIVRVDNKCPYGLENCFCKNQNTCCEDCKIVKNYGDTKEQLIVKVQQALFKSVFTEEVQKAVVIEEQERIYKQYRPMAEMVVEFLGVEE